MRAVRGRARPAARARRAPARGRLAGAGGVHRHAGVGGRPAARLPARRRSGAARRARDAAGLPRADRGRARRWPTRRARGCATSARGTSRTTRTSSRPSARAATRRRPSRAVAPYAALARACAGRARRARRATSSCSARWPASSSRPRAPPRVAGDDPRPAARARVRGAGVVAARLHRRHRPGRRRSRPRWRRRRCPRAHAIWITETGVGPAPGGLSLARGITSEAQGCRLLHRRLRDWHADPRVTVAVQYTMREDDLFPTGLVTTDLARARPALREWQAWGARERAERAAAALDLRLAPGLVEQPQGEHREADHDAEHPVLRAHRRACVAVDRQRAVVRERQRRPRGRRPRTATCDVPGAVLADQRVVDRRATRCRTGPSPGRTGPRPGT